VAERKTESRRSRSGRVAAGILVVVVVLFSAVSQISYVAGLTTTDSNWGGWLGCYLARGLDFALGRAGLAVPLLVALAALVAFSRGKQWRRTGAFGLLVLGLFAAGALLGYQTGSVSPQDNFGGWTGSALAGVLSWGLGLGAYALAALAMYWGFALWFRPSNRADLLQTAFILCIGLLVDLFLGYCAGKVLVSTVRPGFRLAGELGSRGAVLLRQLLGGPGCLIALVAAALIVLVVFTSIRLPEFGWLYALVRRLVARVRGRSAPERAETKRPRETERPEPREPEPEPRAPDTESRSDEPPRIVQPKPPRKVKLNLGEFQKEFLEQLDQPDTQVTVFKDPAEAQAEATVLLDKLRQFGIDGRVSEIQSGPMITRFELEPAPGVKIQRIENLADDLSLALSAERIRILAPIPGKSAVGVEIPNKDRRTVWLREVLTSEPFRQEQSPLGFALGTTITGEPCAADLRTMPHMLIAGTTGSGKSVCINSLIMSIIYRSSPQMVRFLTIDPKQLELPVYNSIPHLLSPTTTDPKRAVDGLTRMVAIMEARYGEFANLGVRDIAAYNELAEQQGLARKPYIVVVIDELADLMLRAPNEIEERITRLAQMSRAVGIHLVLATQRPSVDVITGLIKANFPCRVAFQVASKTDSRTILDMNGAESLLGRGDMLFLPPGKGDPARLHGTFVSDRAAQRVVALWTRQYLTEQLSGLVEGAEEKARQLLERDVADVFYDRERAGSKKRMEDLRSVLPEDVIDNLMARRYHEALPEESLSPAPDAGSETGADRELDEKFAEAARIVVRHREASVSMLQRRLDIGWARAGRIIDQLEQAGVVGPYVGSKSRKVLIESEGDLERMLKESEELK
jgi:S-DNA-T family DNA segregation ATPase FtsK/SpoIIIE